MGPASRQDDSWKALPPAERARTFAAKPLWQRAAIVAAGPITNLLFSVLIFSVFFSLYGQPQTPPLLAAVAPHSAAEKAGLRRGDFVTSVNGEAVSRFEDIKRIVMIRPGEPLAIAFERDRKPMTVIATPSLDEQVDRFGNHYRQGLLGIAPVAPVVRPLKPHRAVQAAVVHSYELVWMIIDTTGQVISGRRSLDEMGGPLKIAQFSGQQAAMGWPDLIEFMALISINLGFINLLPVPMLDGGHLLFYGIEAIRRRPVGQRTQEWAFRSGLALIATLMLLVTVNDLGSLGLWTGLARLIS
jgi:regulator of sigma E protease